MRMKWRRTSRDGAVVRVLASHQCGPSVRFRLGALCGLIFLLLLDLAPSVGFSPGFLVVRLPENPIFLYLQRRDRHEFCLVLT